MEKRKIQKGGTVLQACEGYDLFNQKENVPPMSDQGLMLQKGLDALKILLTTPRTKEAQPNTESDTIDRSRLLLISQMVTKSNPELASELLRLVGRILFYLTTMFLKQASPQSALQHFFDECKEDHGESLLTVHPHTLSDLTETIRINDADRCLSQQTDMLHRLMKKQGAAPEHNMAAIDNNYTVFRGKYLNQCHPIGYQGQKNMYRPSFGEIAVFEGPQQFVVKSEVKWKQKSVYKQAHLPIWLPKIQSTLKEIHDVGQTPGAIYGDREYYSGVGMGFAYLGLLIPCLPLTENPRLVVPMKWSGGTEEKWTFLRSPTAQQIEHDSITVDHYQKSVLAPFMNRLKTNAGGTKVEVPVWKVAIFDSYVNGKSAARTLDWAQAEARRIADKIARAQTELQQAEIAYLSFQKEIKRKTCSTPTYKGKRKWKFKHPNEKPFYSACCKCYDTLNRIEKQKTKLCKRLIFFTVSQREGEALDASSEEIFELVRGYHQRWGIENAFKSLKLVFLIRTRQRGATARHVRRIAGILVYNTWQYIRWSRAIRKAKIQGKNPVIYRGKYIQKRNLKDLELDPNFTAERYILSLLETGIKSRLENILKGGNYM